MEPTPVPAPKSQRPQAVRLLPIPEERPAVVNLGPFDTHAGVLGATEGGTIGRRRFLRRRRFGQSGCGGFFVAHFFLIPVWRVRALAARGGVLRFFAIFRATFFFARRLYCLREIVEQCCTLGCHESREADASRTSQGPSPISLARRGRTRLWPAAARIRSIGSAAVVTEGSDAARGAPSAMSPRLGLA